MAAAAAAAATLLVYREGQGAATDLIYIALTGHVALGFRQFSAANQGVAAKALPAVLSTGQAKPLRIAVGDTFRCGDLVIAKVGESDTTKSPVTAAQLI
jgi:hypothetical protein